MNASRIVIGVLGVAMIGLAVSTTILARRVGEAEGRAEALRKTRAPTVPPPVSMLQEQLERALPDLATEKRFRFEMTVSHENVVAELRNRIEELER